MEHIIHKGQSYNLLVSQEGIVRIGTFKHNRWLVEIDPRSFSGYNEDEHNKFVAQAKRIAEETLRAK